MSYLLNPYIYSKGYTMVSGVNKAPIYGAGGGTYPPTASWTGLVNANADDTSIALPALSFNFYMFGTAYTATYIGSNSYLTFGAASNAYTSLSATNPAIPKLMFGAGDNSYQRVSTLSTINYFRVRYEGNGTTSGTLGSPGIVVEITLFNPIMTQGNSVIEMLVGTHNRTAGVSNITSASGTGQTFTIAANTSYVFIGDSTGNNFSVNTTAYMGDTDY